MSTPIVPQTVQPDNTPATLSPAEQLALFQLLAAELHRGAKFVMLWTPNGDTYYDAAGEANTGKDSFYVPVGQPLQPPAYWQGRNLYFGVNGLGIVRPRNKASHNEDVTHVNALLAEFDGKDFIDEHEWQPFYVLPDLAGMTDAKARGELTKAETAAIDAAYKVNPTVYKARALAHIRLLSIRPSACWDSGGGYQCVWLLAETIAVDAANYDQVAKLQKKWTAFVDGDRAASDLRRILRVPGSLNYKPKYAPNYPLVTFLWCDLDCRYNVGELDALLPAETPKAKAKAIHIPAGVELKPIAPFTLPKHPVIDAYNKATNLHELLLGLGYSDAGDKRMNRPGADTAGLELNTDNTATIYSTADPLFCGHRITPAHALCAYTHAGNVDAMIAALFFSFPDIKFRYDAIRTLHAFADSPACLVALRAEFDAAGVSVRGAYSAHRVYLRLTQLARSNVTYTLSKDVSTRRIAEQTAMSHTSARAALERLQEIKWIIVTPGDDGEMTVTLTPDKSVSFTPLAVSTTGGKDTDGPLSATNGDDFYASTPALVHALGRRTDDKAKGLAWDLAAKRVTTAEAAAAYGMLPTLGPAARYLVAALQVDSLTAKQAIALSGLTRSACYTAAHRLHALGLLEVDAERRMSLVGDFDAKLDGLQSIRPKTRTFGNTQRRLELHSRERSSHLQALLAKADQAETKRIMRLMAARDRYESEAGKLRVWLELAGLKPAKGPDWTQIRSKPEQARYERQKELGRLDGGGLPYTDAWTILQLTKALRVEVQWGPHSPAALAAARLAKLEAIAERAGAA